MSCQKCSPRGHARATRSGLAASGRSAVMTRVLEPRPTSAVRAPLLRVAPPVPNVASGRPPALRVAERDRERIGVRLFGGVRAWMVVPVVDFALILAPLLWRPPQIHAMLLMAVVATLLLTDGGRYVAPLHLSVLDELPSIMGRLLIAVAGVS